MLRHFILLILLTTVVLAKCQRPKSSFRTLTIGFQYGDEAISYKELHFKKIGNKIIGSISHPNTNKVLLSDVELNVSQTKTIDSFLSLTEKYNTTPCKEKNVSSYIQYTLVFATGCNNGRTRLYRMGITDNLVEIKKDFEVYGLRVDNNVWEEFISGDDFEAFIVKRKIVKIYTMTTIEKLHNSKLPIIALDKSLEQFRDKEIFPKKMEKAKGILKNRLT